MKRTRHWRPVTARGPVTVTALTAEPTGGSRTRRMTGAGASVIRFPPPRHPHRRAGWIRVPPMSDADRFLSHVDKSGDCWTWTAGVDRQGYGRFRLGPQGKSVPAHRWLYQHVLGPTDLCILHRCDNPRCVRLSHLFAGTRTENAADKVAKGRMPKGTDYPQAVLNPELVRTIRRLRSTGMSCRAIAESIGRKQAPVYDVVRGKTWRHVQ